MDHQQPGRFSTIPARALFDPNLDNAALRVLGILGCYSDRFGWCFPSLATLAKETGVSRQAISKQIGILVALGYLKSQTRHRQDGGRTSNRYQVIFDSPEPPDDSQVAPPQPLEVDRSQPLEVAPITAQVIAHNSSSPGGDEDTPPAGNSPRKFTGEERNAIWDTLVAATGVEPLTKTEKSNHGGAVKQLLEADFTPQHIRVACREWQRIWGDRTITVNGIVKHISTLLISRREWRDQQKSTQPHV